MERGRRTRLALQLALVGLLALLFFTGCKVVEDFGRSLDDLFRGITIRFP